MYKLNKVVSIIIAVFVINANSAFAQSPMSGLSNTELFNGKNLDGWYTYIMGRGKNLDPLNVFSVQNGTIHISGEEYGSMVTEKEYDNYRLIVEFKWVDKTFAPRKDNARDGGILLHSKGKDGRSYATLMNSIECQIIEGGTGDFIVFGDGSKSFSITAKVASENKEPPYYYHPDGNPMTINRGRINWFARDPEWKDQLGFRGKLDIEKPVGEWNTIEFLAVGGNISIYLNGVLVNEAYQVQPQQGKVQIQSAGAEMFIRRVGISPLPQKQLVSIHANDGKGVGPKIKLMPEWNAFGYFTSFDKIEWNEIMIPDNNTYDVYLEWSISDTEAGKPFVLQIGNTQLEGIVQKSGSWEDFRTIKIGTLKLQKGKYAVSFRPKEETLEGGLMDFREIKLVPLHQ